MVEDKHEARLRVLEKELAVVKNELKHIREDICNFSNGVSRVVWIFAGGLIAAVVSWVVRGGLTL